MDEKNNQLITFDSMPANIVQLRDEVRQLRESIEKNKTSKEWLDNFDVKQLLNISDRTLVKYRTKKFLPFSKIGAKIYYRLEDINNLLLNNMKE